VNPKQAGHGFYLVEIKIEVDEGRRQCICIKYNMEYNTLKSKGKQEGARD